METFCNWRGHDRDAARKLQLRTLDSKGPCEGWVQCAGVSFSCVTKVPIDQKSSSVCAAPCYTVYHTGGLKISRCSECPANLRRLLGLEKWA